MADETKDMLPDMERPVKPTPEIDWSLMRQTEKIRKPVETLRKKNPLTPLQKAFKLFEDGKKPNEHTLIKWIRKLSQEERQVFLRHVGQLRSIMITDESHTYFSNVIRDWQSLCYLADTKDRSPSRYTKQRKVRVWELIEKSAPIFINGEQWLVRVMHDTVKKKVYLDITDGAELHLTLEPEHLSKILNPTIKLLNKWLSTEQK